MTSFNYELEQLTASEDSSLNHRIIVSASDWGKCIATQEIAYYAINRLIQSNSKDFGKILVPCDAITNYSSPAGSPLPAAHIGFIDSDDAHFAEVALKVFSDLSCVIFRREFTGPDDRPVYRLHPVPLRINSDPRYDLRLTFSSGDKNTILLRVAYTDEALLIDLFNHEDTSLVRPGEYDRYQVLTAIKRDMEDHLHMLGTLPILRHCPHGERRSGIFGLHSPAPAPELAGYTYDCPAYLSWSGVAAEQVSKMDQFLQYATVMALQDTDNRVTGLAIKLHSAHQLGPTRSRAKLSIQVGHGPLTKSELNEIQYLLKQRIHGLLSSPNAPFDYKKIEGGMVYVTKGKKASKLTFEPADIGKCAKHLPLSAHDIVDAHRFFN